MKLDDFLKYKKVRCVNFDATGLTNKEYELLGVTDRSCIINDNGCEIWSSMDNFEPVLDSAENPLEGAELTSEFETEALEPKFEVGNKVYFPNMAGGEILTLLDNKACHYPFFVNVVNAVNNSLYELDSNGKTKYGNFTDFAVKATSENHEMLCKLYPHIEFERPTLKGSDLARAMLDKGWKYVPCYVSNTSDKNAVELDDCGVIYTVNYNGNFRDGYGESWCHAVPFDPRTGNPLTESILND